jgi:hypothetical protein
MKRLFNVLALVLAMNFLAVAGFAGWLVKGGRLNKDKALAIREILFPSTQPTAPATQPAEEEKGGLKLDELLAQTAGKPPEEQLGYIRQAFDAQMTQLERAQKELNALRSQALMAQQSARAEREALEKAIKEFQEKQALTEKLAADKGFQDSLAMYTTLPAKQVKTLFMGLDVETAVQYLQAMEPRTAARITKEFKSSDETDRLKQIMAKMRDATAQASATP